MTTNHPTESERRQAYRAGRSAYETGQHEDANPYLPGSWLHARWALGHFDARKDDEG